MKEIIPIISAILLSSLLLTSAVSANSAQMAWSGVTATGTIITDQNCPIVVESELLTFDINEFPKEYYGPDAVDEYLAYDGRVTAQYTFYNPADYTVTATLVFPFGRLPEYSYVSKEALFLSDSDRYGITVNGEKIPMTIRHTLSERYFDIASDIPRLKDSFTDDEFYYPEMPVYCETVKVTGITDENGRANILLRWHDYSTDKRTIIVEPQGDGVVRGYFTDKNAFRQWVYNGCVIKVWYFGEYHGSPEWMLYDGKLYDGEEPTNTISGTVETSGEAEEMTFMDFAMQGYTEDSGISRADWYNARVDDINRNAIFYGDSCAFTRYDLIHIMLRWYQYEITLQPHQRITNTVTAPIYPSINAAYNPNIYGYTYLLSPARTWSDFGALDIVVNTPFYITESNIGGFEKTDGGYTLSLNGLPEGELTFTVSESKNPTYYVNPLVFIAYGILFLPFLILLIALAIGIVILVRHKRKKQGIAKS